jgi:nucleotide-binding universal stress UspA family protein
MALTNVTRPTIVHPTDFSPGDASAFAHALAMTVSSKAELRLLRVRVEGGPYVSPTHGLRQVRDLLARWGIVDKDAPYDRWDAKLDFRVTSASIAARNARAGVLEYLDDSPCNLVVLASYPNKSPTRWLDGSVHRRLLRQGRLMSLFLREGERGFVDTGTGAITLKKILAPIDDSLDNVSAIRRLEGMLKLSACEASIEIMHVGKRAPQLTDENGEAFDRPILLREGPVVDTILATAGELDVDAIAMPTAGRHGLIDAMRGSTSARIVDDARWPVLAVPVG